jgi:hypothetical protein
MYIYTYIYTYIYIHINIQIYIYCIQTNHVIQVISANKHEITSEYPNTWKTNSVGTSASNQVIITVGHLSWPKFSGLDIGRVDFAATNPVSEFGASRPELLPAGKTTTLHVPLFRIGKTFSKIST